MSPYKKRRRSPKWAKYYLALDNQKRTGNRDKVSAGHLEAFFQNNPLDQIITSRIEAYKTHRQTPEEEKHLPAPATINRGLVLLRARLCLAFQGCLLAYRTTVTLLAENNERTRLPSPAEYQAILDALPTESEMRAVWLLTLKTVMRIGERLGLTRPGLDLKTRFVAVEQ